jgi:hypothetical protein
LYVAVSVFIAGVLLLLFEGLSSFVLVSKEAFKPAPELAERRYTQYDAEIGWVSVPNVFIKDLYGPGAYLRTNKRGFRNNVEFDQKVPPGKVRAICSGDSFALGYGVSNDDTWCQKLTELDRRLEAVNMGQGGYGMDQAYLWYIRDGAVLDHDLHLWSFTGLDLARMETTSFEGYPKPTMELDLDRLVTRGVPVPRKGVASRITQALNEYRDLRSVTLLRRMFFEQKGRAAEEASSDTVAVAGAILKKLRDLNLQKNSVFVVVFLPTEIDYRRGATGSVARLRELATDVGISWIDLNEDFQKRGPAEVATYFIQLGATKYELGAGHYTAEGNRFVAERLYERLTAIPASAAKLPREVRSER